MIGSCDAGVVLLMLALLLWWWTKVARAGSSAAHVGAAPMAVEVVGGSCSSRSGRAGWLAALSVAALSTVAATAVLVVGQGSDVAHDRAAADTVGEARASGNVDGSNSGPSRRTSMTSTVYKPRNARFFFRRLSSVSRGPTLCFACVI